MGLDGVEIVMDVEKEFDLDLNDAEIGRCRTVADLVALVARHLGIAFARGCPSAQAFYRIRRVLMDRFSIARPRIRPSVRLRSLVKRNQIPALREAVIDAGLDWPERVKCRDWISAPFGLFLIAVAVLGGVGTLLTERPLPFFLTVLLIYPLAFLFARSRLVPPESMWSTVEDMVRGLAPADTLSSVHDGERLDDVSLRIRTIIAEQMGYALEQVHESSSFVDDLQID